MDITRFNKYNYYLAIIGIGLLGVTLVSAAQNRNASSSRSDVLGVASTCSGKLEGVVFHDKNANGKRDSSEPGVSGVQATAFSGATKVAGSTKSGSDGKYSIAVSNGTRVRLEFSFTNDSLGFASGPHGVDSRTNVTFVTVGTNSCNVNFGTVNNSNGPIEIGNYIWEDDGDGIQEPNERPIPNVTVTLATQDTGNDTDTVCKTKTDANGQYFFTSGVNGCDIQTNRSYWVKIKKEQFVAGGALAGMKATKDNASNDINDSDGYQRNSSDGSISEIFAFFSQGSCQFCNCNHNYDFGFVKSGVTPTGTGTNTPSPTKTNTPSPTATTTPTRLPNVTTTRTVEATVLPTNTSTPSPTNTPTPTNTNTPTPTSTSTPTPTFTATPSPTPPSQGGTTVTPTRTTAVGNQITPTPSGGIARVPQSTPADILGEFAGAPLPNSGAETTALLIGSPILILALAGIGFHVYRSKSKVTIRYRK